MKSQLRSRSLLLAASVLLYCGAASAAQESPQPQDATTAIVRAFDSHNIVMLGEIHGNKQLYGWLRKLVATPAFSDRVDDIVMEFGNSLYQKSVDEYVSGQNVPFAKVERAWRNMVGSIGPPSPVYGSLYRAVRDANMKRRGHHQIRILCGDPYIDWDKVRDAKDVRPYMAHRDDWYAQVVKDEVLAKHHRALLIMGAMHFLRNFEFGPNRATIENELRQAGANTYLILAGTNTPELYPRLDHRFDGWPVPAIAPATGWLGELPAQLLMSGGQQSMVVSLGSGLKVPPLDEPKLKDGADAFLYLGPRDSLTRLSLTRAELEGTPYLKELERRLKIQGMDWLPLSQILEEKPESPQFPPPEPGKQADTKASGKASGPQSSAQPEPAKASITLSSAPRKPEAPPPLPPRPPSQ